MRQPLALTQVSAGGLHRVLHVLHCCMYYTTCRDWLAHTVALKRDIRPRHKTILASPDYALLLLVRLSIHHHACAREHTSTRAHLLQIGGGERLYRNKRPCNMHHMTSQHASTACNTHPETTILSGKSKTTRIDGYVLLT